jgi:hypothetical protein
LGQRQWDRRFQYNRKTGQESRNGVLGVHRVEPSSGAPAKSEKGKNLVVIQSTGQLGHLHRAQRVEEDRIVS